MSSSPGIAVRRSIPDRAAFPAGAVPPPAAQHRPDSAAPALSHLGYRREIDGLRAVAVIPVILFHAGWPGMPGGFVGVDVFFVISGFLITGVIARELALGSFSTFDFYERRARRLLPALFTVLMATTVAAFFILLPHELADYGERLKSVIFSVSNIHFWQETGYFAAAAEFNPLLHTWSLAVEEQFYIFFPLLLFAIWRWRLGIVGLILLSLLLGSLALSQFLSERAPSANFFLLPTRAWELLCGALLALYLLRNRQPTGPLADLLAALGLGAIAASLFYIDPSLPFPSLIALVPVLGTVLFIYAASPDTLVGRLLAHPAPVGIGLISYSAYLWHQPLISFARLSTPDHHPPLAWLLLLGALSLGLAWLSWKFVETPFRRRDHMSPQAVFRGALAGGLLFVGIGIVLVRTGGVAERYAEGERHIVAFSDLEHSTFVESAYGEIADLPLSSERPNLVLVGDSFSQDFFNIVRKAEAFSNYAKTAIYIPRVCQILFGEALSPALDHIAPANRQMCASRRLSDAHTRMLRQADIVIFVSRWQDWGVAGFSGTLAALDLPDETDVIVVGTKTFESDRRALLAAFRSKGEAARVPVDPSLARLDGDLRAAAGSARFVDILQTVCTEGCPLFTPEGQMISYDGIHLTEPGAEYLASILFGVFPLAEYAR